MKDGLLKRGLTWSYVARIRDPKTGRMKAHWVGGFPTKTAARRARNDARSASDRGIAVVPSSTTVGEYLTLWVVGVEPQVKATTYGSYKMHVEQHIIPALGHHRLQALSTGMVNAFYTELLKDGRKKRAKETEDAKTDDATATAPKAAATMKTATKKDTTPGLSPNSVRRIAATLHRALRDAVDDGSLSRNPASRAKLPKVDVGAPREMLSWTAEELRDFLDATQGQWTYPLFYLAATTGMRRGELCGLRWKDVDLKKRKVTVQNARVVVGTETQGSSPKRGKRRIVDIDAATGGVLKAHRKAQAAEHLAYAGAAADLGYVFTQDDGQPLHPDYVTRAFGTAVRKSGARRIRLHDLRHTHASLMLANGVNVKVVSERLGHSTPAFTMAVYQHVQPGQQEDAADGFAAMLASAKHVAASAAEQADSVGA